MDNQNDETELWKTYRSEMKDRKHQKQSDIRTKLENFCEENNHIGFEIIQEYQLRLISPELTVEVIKKIQELSDPKILTVGDREYSSKHLHEIPLPSAKPLEVFSLTSLIDYINRDPDDVPKFFINIAGYNQVCLYGSLDGNLKRSLYLQASVSMGINANNYMPPEEFVLMLQTSFAPTEEQKALLKISSNISDDFIRTDKDNGVSQTATIKTGITLLEKIELPNPVKLIPYRTFPEIAQPECEYIFRGKKGTSGPLLGLFDCNSNHWELQTIIKIKAYLKSNLKEAFLVI